MNRKITFEIGDIAFCPYYSFKGVIESFQTSDGVELLTLRNLVNNTFCVTRVKTDSLNDFFPCYLQLVCKKAEYNNISNRVIFGAL